MKLQRGGLPKSGASGGNLQLRSLVICPRFNLEDAMTDYRDPNYRDPNRPDYRGPAMPADSNWSTATWGWIAGISVVVLVLIFAFGVGERDRTATDNSRPPATTTGQSTLPAAPPAAAPSQAPSMNPVPADPAPATPPAKQ
jgi:hypothetical protein